MIHKLLSGLGIIAFIAFLIGGLASIPDKCQVDWAGEIDTKMVARAKTELAACEVLVVNLDSPGGDAIQTLDLINAMEKHKAAGRYIEIHGGAFIASAATLVLSAGTKGRRYMRRDGIALVHAMQEGNWSGMHCVPRNPDPKTDSAKMAEQIYESFIRKYSKYSGEPIEKTTQWLTCENTQVGDGRLMVKLGLADKLED